MAEKSSTKEKLRRKIKITQATVEAAIKRMEEYNRNDEIAEGLFWAYEELKEVAFNHIEIS